MLQVLQAGWNPIGDWPAMNTTGAGFMAAGLTDAVTYIGGMPVGLTSGGFVIGGQSGQIEVTAAATLLSNFVGLLYNNSTIDTRRGTGDKNATYNVQNAVPTIVPLPCYVKMWRGQSGSTDFPVSHDAVDDRAPFLTDTWAINDLIYVEASATAADNGRLTDTAGSPNTVPIGRVLRAPSTALDYMIALFWEVPYHAHS